MVKGSPSEICAFRLAVDHTPESTVSGDTVQKTLRDLQQPGQPMSHLEKANPKHTQGWAQIRD